MFQETLPTVSFTAVHLAIERKEDYKATVLDAMIHNQIAWEKVTATAIANCFRHAGFGHPANGNDVTPKEGDMDSVEGLGMFVSLWV